MQWRRRRFLVGGLGAGLALAAAGSVWAGLSRGRTARLVRQLVGDTFRAPPPAPVTPRPETWPENGITVCWLGHATVLIDFYGVRILTDPVFSGRVGADLGLATLGPKRYVAPALDLAQLPPIDVVLISHAHMDHLDIPTLKRLALPHFAVTAPDTSDLLAGTRVEGAVELGWGERTTFHSPRGDLNIRAFPVAHWGRRWPSEKDRGYNGYVLSREGRSLLFAGDTAFTPRLAEVRRLGPFEAALMPIGAYDPWIRNHCNPEQAVIMADQAGARRIVPIHFSTFKLSDEPLDEPLARLESALTRESGRLGLRRPGEHCVLS
jgi:L-ascorbate metabolism protein UlaG (beta-lactamase superfamily)